MTMIMFKMYKLFLLLFLFSFSVIAEAKKEIPLKPYLKNAVSYKDVKKVAKLKKKADKLWKSKHEEKRLAYYVQAAQLGDCEAQVKAGFYYGFGTFYPRFVGFNAKK